MSSILQVTDRELRVRFAPPWSLEDYELFLKTKDIPEMSIDYENNNEWPPSEAYVLRAPARFARMLEQSIALPEVPLLPLAEYLFDFQQWIVLKAIEAKRFAIWADCGLGKTPMQLEWARQVVHLTGGRVLIMAPLEVCRQTAQEAVKFYGPEFEVRRCASREELQAWCLGQREGAVAIANYEKMIPGEMPELRHLAGLVLDESSILKSGGGVIKWNLIKSAKGIEYKLSCTATPAPNDTMEYASQAGFLEKLRNEGDILWTFFHRDPKSQRWTVKPHARSAFYQFMASWSIYLRKPAAYGFADPFADVPEPEIIEERIAATPEQLEDAKCFQKAADPDVLVPAGARLGMVARTKLSQIAKGFIYEGKSARRIPSLKPERVAALVRQALAEGHQCLVWTVYDEESELLLEALSQDHVRGLTGKDSEKARSQKLAAFCAGEVRVLISKASLLGYGLNFQFCTRMVFSGFDDSFERFYQAVRRCYRYGSREQLRVFVPYIPTLEDHMWENILRKRDQWETDTAEQERMYREALNHAGGVNE